MVIKMKVHCTNCGSVNIERKKYIFNWTYNYIMLFIGATLGIATIIMFIFVALVILAGIIEIFNLIKNRKRWTWACNACGNEFITANLHRSRREREIVDREVQDSSLGETSQEITKAESASTTEVKKAELEKIFKPPGRFKQNSKIPEGETEAIGNLLANWRKHWYCASRGIIIVTEQRFIWCNHKKRVELPFSDINKIRCKNFLFVVPTGLVINSQNGKKYIFVVAGRVDGVSARKAIAKYVNDKIKDKINVTVNVHGSR